MAQRKRQRNAEHDSDNKPRKSARLATTVSPADGSDEPSNSADSGRTREEILSDALALEAEKIVNNKDKAELLILGLMRKYTFNFSHLKEMLGSKANYSCVARLICS